MTELEAMADMIAEDDFLHQGPRPDPELILTLHHCGFTAAELNRWFDKAKELARCSRSGFSSSALPNALSSPVRT